MTSSRLQIQSFTFGPFGTNTYVVSTSYSPVLLIDPACSNPYEQQQLCACINRLTADSRQAVRVVATHGHLDHLWGAAWACSQWKTSVLLHPADMPMARAMQQQYDLFGIRRTAETFPVEPLESADFQVIHTPGHTPGSVCIHFPEDGVLFSGDTLFRMGYGRTDLPGGNMAQLITSLEHLFTLPPDTRVFPGHGETTLIAAEAR